MRNIKNKQQHNDFYSKNLRENKTLLELLRIVKTYVIEKYNI